MAVVRQVLVDVDLEIRKLLLEKCTVRDIAKRLGTSKDRVGRVRKEMMGVQPIRKRRDDCDVKTRVKDNRTNQDTPQNPDESTIEGTRKRVELKALEVLEARLDDPDCDAKTATAALGVVGTKPKAESGDITVFIQSISNFGSEARKRMIERTAAERQGTIIEGKEEVLSDTQPAEIPAPENHDGHHDA